FSSRRRHTIFSRDWSSDVCSSDLCTNSGLPMTIMLDLNESEEFTALRSAVRSFALAELAPQVDEYDRADRFHEYLWPKLGEMGRSEERRVGKECRYGCWQTGDEDE